MLKRRICLKHLNLLKTKFTERGYPLEMVEENFRRINPIERADLLKPKPIYPHNASPTIPGKQKFTHTCIITYNPHNPNLKKWLQEAQIILLSDQKIPKLFPKPPSVSFRQARNLKQILVQSKFKELPFRDISDTAPPGCFKYQHGSKGKKCELCPKLRQGIKFKSNFTGLSYKIRYNLTCKSKYCVYLISCTCGKQYTGCTTSYMHIRHNGHRQEITNRSTELGEHFAKCGYNNLSLQIIDCVKEGDSQALIQQEAVWQHRLATFKVHGNLNSKDELIKTYRKHK